MGAFFLSRRYCMKLNYFKAIVIADFIQDLMEGEYEIAAITFDTFHKYYRSVTKKQRRTAKKLDGTIPPSLSKKRKNL